MSYFGDFDDQAAYVLENPDTPDYDEPSQVGQVEVVTSTMDIPLFLVG